MLLDRDLAELYGVETRVLNQAVRRNVERFPSDFMFSLSRNEIVRISQIVISSVVFDAIRELMTPPVAARKGEIGFHTGITALRRGPAHAKQTKAKA